MIGGIVAPGSGAGPGAAAGPDGGDLHGRASYSVAPWLAICLATCEDRIRQHVRRARACQPKPVFLWYSRFLLPAVTCPGQRRNAFGLVEVTRPPGRGERRPWRTTVVRQGSRTRPSAVVGRVGRPRRSPTSPPR